MFSHATVKCMIEITSEQYQQLRRLVSELDALLLRIAPPGNPRIDELVARVAGTQEQWQASRLYDFLKPDVRPRMAAQSMLRLGWIRVRRDQGIFWVKPAS